jgi:hypothetical protein
LGLAGNATTVWTHEIRVNSIHDPAWLDEYPKVIADLTVIESSDSSVPR